MGVGWQDLVAVGIVALAVLYLGRLALGAVIRKQDAACGSGCGKCGGGSSPSGAPAQLVTIGMQTPADRPGN